LFTHLLHGVAEASDLCAQDYDPTQTEKRTYFVRLPFPDQVAMRLKVGFRNIRGRKAPY
jgi:hypothetical protein